MRAPVLARDTELEALRQIVAELEQRNTARDQVIAQLEQRVATLEAVNERQLADAEWLTTLTASVRGHTFTISELLEYAAVDMALRHALAGMSPRVIAARLKRLARHPLRGFRLAPIRREEDGCRWELLIQEPAGGRRPVTL